MIQKIFLKLLSLYKISHDDMPNWNNLLSDNKINLNQKKFRTKKILIATCSGGHKVATTIDSMLGIYLSLLGAKISFLLCDKVLPYCIMKTMRNNNIVLNNLKNTMICSSCFDCGKKTFNSTGLDLLTFSNYLNKEDFDYAKRISHQKTIKEILKYKFDNLNIGEQVHASTCRYYAASNYTNEKNYQDVVRGYFYSALLTLISIKKILNKKKIDTIIVNHGFYIPQGIISEYARLNSIDFVTWTSGTRKNTFYFTRNNIYYKDLVNENINNWKNIQIKEHEKKIDKYLNSKVIGLQDYNYFKNKTTFNVNSYLKKRGLNLSKPVVSLATNVIWDAQLHYDDTIFDNMMDWVIQTIEYFKNRNDLNLVIRIHPTETQSDRPAREKVADEIYKKFSKLPNNILIINSHETISTYSVLDISDAILTYGSKLDIEYAARGYHVIVAGDAITKNKGIVLEPKSQKEYFKYLEKLPFRKKLRKNIHLEAKKYAYYFFFKKAVELDSLIEKPYHFPPFKISKKFAQDISNYKNSNLDTICKLILDKKKSVFIS